MPDFDFDERMTTINCDEDGSNQIHVYIRLTTVKGFKQAGDKEAHADLGFVNPCGVFEMVDMPLSQLPILIRLLQEACKDWKAIELEDYQVEGENRVDQDS